MFADTGPAGVRPGFWRSMSRWLPLGYRRPPPAAAPAPRRACGGRSTREAQAANLPPDPWAGPESAYISPARWKLKLYLRAKLECRVFGAVWPLIWLILGGFRFFGAVGTDFRTDPTLTRR